MQSILSTINCALAQPSCQMTRQVSLKTVIITFHTHLSEFFSQQRDLSKHASDVCNLNAETFEKLSKFLSQCDRVINTANYYESLSVEQRLKVFTKQKEWIAIAEELKRVQVISDPVFTQITASNNPVYTAQLNAILAAASIQGARIDNGTYKSFLLAKKQAHLHVQRDNLLKKFNKQQQQQSPRKRQLPPIPDFEDQQQQQQQATAAVSSMIKIKVEHSTTTESPKQEVSLNNSNKLASFNVKSESFETEDNLSNVSTSDSTESSTFTHLKRAGYKITSSSSPRDVQVITSISGVETLQVPVQIQSPQPARANLENNNMSMYQQSQNKKYSSYRFTKIEEELLQVIEKLNLESDAASMILKGSLTVGAFLSELSGFFKNKTYTVIAASIVLYVSRHVGFLITTNALASAIRLNERCLSKVTMKLTLKLKDLQLTKNMAAIDVEQLIERIAMDLGANDSQTLAASSYLYNSMCVKGLIKGTRVDLLAASIVFLSATLNEAPVTIEDVQRVLGVSVDILTPTITLILENKATLINNSTLFRMQHMLLP